MSSAANIPSKELEDWGIHKTIGEPKCQLRGLFISENEDGSEAGIWECTPGKFIREVNPRCKGQTFQLSNIMYRKAPSPFL